MRNRVHKSGLYFFYDSDSVTCLNQAGLQGININLIISQKLMVYEEFCPFVEPCYIQKKQQSRPFA